MCSVTTFAIHIDLVQVHAIARDMCICARLQLYYQAKSSATENLDISKAILVRSCCRRLILLISSFMIAVRVCVLHLSLLVSTDAFSSISLIFVRSKPYKTRSRRLVRQYAYVQKCVHCMYECMYVYTLCIMYVCVCVRACVSQNIPEPSPGRCLFSTA